MFKCAAFACLFAAVAGFRTVRVRNKNNATNAETIDHQSGAAIRPNFYLERLTGNSAEDILVDVIEGLAKVNWDGNLLDAMKSIARSQAVSFAQSIVSTAHPLLGAVFSVIASIFNFEGASSGESITKKILTEVQGMIKTSLRQYAVGGVRKEISKAMQAIRYAEDRKDRWKDVDETLGQSFITVFDPCWNSNGNSCRDWRVNADGGTTLVMETMYTELTLNAMATIAKHGFVRKSFTRDIEKASNLTRAHWLAWKGARENHGKHLEIGQVSCFGRLNNKRCEIKESRDKLVGRNLSDIYKDDVRRDVQGVCNLRSSSCSSPSCTSTRASLEKARNRCITRFKTDIKNSLHNLGKQSRACQNAAGRLARSKWR